MSSFEALLVFTDWLSELQLPCALSRGILTWRVAGAARVASRRLFVEQGLAAMRAALGCNASSFTKHRLAAMRRQQVMGSDLAAVVSRRNKHFEKHARVSTYNYSQVLAPLFLLSLCFCTRCCASTI